MWREGRNMGTHMRGMQRLEREERGRLAGSSRLDIGGRGGGRELDERIRGGKEEGREGEKRESVGGENE